MTALAVTHAGPALAASIAPSPKQIGAAAAAVSSCGSLSGIVMSWTSTAGSVTAVSLSNIPAGCMGDVLTFTLAGLSDVSVAGLGPVTLSTTTVAFTSLPAGILANSVTGAYVSIVDP